MPDPTLTANQQYWQAQYESLQAQRQAYKNTVISLSAIEPTDRTPNQVIDLKYAQIQVVQTENRLQLLQFNIDQGMAAQQTQNQKRINVLLDAGQTN